MATPFGVDSRGYEQQFATNHLGHFQLTGRLWPALVNAAGARVVALSSRGHVAGRIDFADPFFSRRPYDTWVAYGQAKTANALFALALDELGARFGVRAFSVHPGPVLTELLRHMSEEELAASVDEAETISEFKTPEQGAATAVWAATNTRLDGLGGSTSKTSRSPNSSPTITRRCAAFAAGPRTSTLRCACGARARSGPT
jgi:NAD(P)-dependent dehydrogenase (short-subunit alcohol dehydrogenase family)